jgi:hypothetical protein
LLHNCNFGLVHTFFKWDINPLNAELNPICHLLALLGGATIVVVSKLRVNWIILMLLNDASITGVIYSLLGTADDIVNEYTEVSTCTGSVVYLFLLA